ncbi:Cys-tRNA(Pro) deacylase [Novosphingobium sp. 9]|uniref:Cys-tRNA(Pro) deacylase n=1 Tax=Novosphingobium sp. 9 TaxID=2025349 RepID=UPI0021B6C002|nr:Cys-tRNA(Pro) deacylase [Novosphingobium sp. 9]
MATATRATAMLGKAGIAFETFEYDYDPGVDSIGEAAAAALGVDPACVFKTLMVMADGKPACAIAPSSGEVSLKRVAAALGVKAAAMMKPADAERISGYKIGGISPFGQTRRVPVVIDESALAHPAIYLNGGRRGLQVRLAGRDAIVVLGAKAAGIAA